MSVKVLLVGGPEHGKIIDMPNLHRGYAIQIAHDNPDFPKGFISDDTPIPVEIFPNGDINIPSMIFERKEYKPKKYLSALYWDKVINSRRAYRTQIWAYFYEDLLEEVKKNAENMIGFGGEIPEEIKTSRVNNLLKEHLFDALIRSWKDTHGFQTSMEEEEEEAHRKFKNWRKIKGLERKSNDAE